MVTRTPCASTTVFAQMAGLDSKTPHPTRIVVHRQSRMLEIEFDQGSAFRLPFEFGIAYFQIRDALTRP